MSVGVGNAWGGAPALLRTKRAVVCALLALVATAPAAARAATATLTASQPAGNALAAQDGSTNDFGSGAAAASFTASGFGPTANGTVNAVTITVAYKTSGTPASRNADTYAFEASVNGTALSPPIVASTSVARTSVVTASQTYSGLTWADVAALQVTGAMTTAGAADGTSVNWDRVSVVVDYTAPSGTTTVGDGDDSASGGALCPGDPPIDLDAFTLVASAGTDSVSALTVSLTGGAGLLSSVSVTSSGGTSYGSVSSPASASVAVALSPAVTATTTPAAYRVRVAPKPHGALAPGVYTVTGTVTGITSGYTPSLADFGSGTVTIDAQPTAAPGSFTATPSPGQIALAWAVPSGAQELLVLRKAGSVPSDAPADGQTYAAGTTLGSSDVVYAGAASGFTDTSVAAGTTYGYAVFARDPCTNWSPAATVSATALTVVRTTLGSGSDPAGATLCPGAAATWVDTFTFDAASADDAVSSVTAGLAGSVGAGGAVAQVEIRGADGSALVPARTAVPSGDSVTFSGASLPAPIGTTTYRLYVTPKGHAGFTGSPTIQPRVTAFAATNPTAGGDTASVFTLDNTAPGPATWGAIAPGGGQIALSWTNPASDFGDVLVVRAIDAAPSGAPVDGVAYAAGAALGTGTVAYAGTAQAYTDAGLQNGTSYWYAIYARDACGNWSAAAVTGPHVPANTLTIGSGSEPPSIAQACPGDAAAALDTFTVQSSAGSDTLTAVQVEFAAGTAQAVSLLEVVGVATGTVHGSVANPPDRVTVPLSPPITAGTALASYQLRVTLKAQAAMPVGTYALSARVVGVTTASIANVGDGSSATFGVDNQPPAAPTWTSAAAGDRSAALAWTNPTSDFAAAVLLRKASAAVTDAPAEGSSPTAGSTVGTSTVAYGGPAASLTDSGLTNGTDYYYRLYARDACGNFSAGAPAGPVRPGGVVTVSSGTQPAGGSIVAGALATVVGSFTLTPSSTPIAVSMLRVENAGNALPSADLQSVQLYEDTDGNGAFSAAADTLVGVLAWSAADARWVTKPSAYSLSAARTFLVLVNVAPGATPGRTFQLRLSPGDVQVAAPHSVATFAAFAGNAFTLTAPSIAEGSATPGTRQATAAIVNPTGPSVSGTFRVQARVYGPTGEGALVVKLATDGSTTTFPYAMSRVDAYGADANAGVFEYQVPAVTRATNLSLRVQVDNGRGATYSKAVQVVALPARTGDGNLLVRDNSSQLCTDCHALQSHGTETVGSKYGAWSTTCRDCHTPHRTRNAELIREQITPPAVNGHQPTRQVAFAKKSGYSATGGVSDRANATYANGDGSGICQGCHTRTSDVAGNPRYRAGSGDDGHGANEKCSKCHGHATGFVATNKQCKDCHLTSGADVDSYALGDGKTALVNASEWQAYGHGAAASYPSGTGPARFAAQGAAVGDAGCLYCHSSSTSHDDAQNPFRLANLGYGANGPCLVCHAKKLDGAAPPGFDPDGAGTTYASIVSAKRVDADHAAGPGHSAPDHTGGNYCWDCHDPHGDTSAAGNVLYFMLQRQLVEQSVAGGPGTSNWGAPVTFAAAYEFNPGIAGGATTWEFQDYYLGGLCTNCHDPENTTAGTGVKYYFKTGTYTATPPHDGGGSLRNRCSDCHTHPIGCGGCHNAPPPSSVHGRHNELTDPAVNYTTTASEATASQYGYRCAKCHGGTHANEASSPTLGKSAATPYQVEVIFDASADPKNPAPAAYARSGAVTSYQGGNGEYWGWQPGTCSNVYCHSNGAPVDAPAAYANVAWTTPGAWSCGSCHGTQASSGTMSTAHALHLGYAAFTCEKCHASVVASSTGFAATGGKALHANGAKDVAFSTFLNNSGGAWDATSLSCSNTYCHSNGVDRVGANGWTSGPSLAWTTTGTITCWSCHGASAAGSPIIGEGTGTPTHANHVDGASVIGKNVGCAACHGATVSGDTTISNRANHVNLAADVAVASITSPTGKVRAGGSYASGSCATAWCHSDGREPSGATTYAPVSWSTTWASGGVCKGCHGRATSLAGEPDYATGNSHAKHVGATAASAAAACVKCHAATVTSSGTAILATAPHLDGDRDVKMATGTWTASTKTCSNVSCHGSGAPVWGTTLRCGDCHSGTEGDPLGNGTPNGVMVEWSTKGHGGALGGSFSSTNQGCDYCHDLAAPHTPTAATNPYRLRFSSTTNALCLQCHAPNDAGVTVEGVLENSTKDVGAAHDGAKHQAGEGGFLCWDCHDPHGTPNVKMVKTAASRTSDTYGVPQTTGAVTFTDDTTAGPGLGRFVELTTSGTKTGVCQACHSPSKGTDATTGSTKYWRWDGSDASASTSTHNASSRCLTCHEHPKKFAGAGGGPDCIGCHGANGQGTRRAVSGDFTKQSHHVGNGGPKMGGTLTNFDCVVCHAEGEVVAGPPRTTATGAYHANGVVDLRNADNGTVYPYDRSGMPAAAASWGSADATWRTQNATNLDPFCLSCHDANGASSAYTLGDATATASNPFADANVANDYDQLVRCNAGVGVGGKFAACAAPGAVLDVKTKVSAPYARHAIRGQSTSIYSAYTVSGTSPDGKAYQSMYDAGGFVSTGASDGTPLWNDTSVMGCADCHTNDGANGAAGNAHGSDSEYLLKDANGGALEGTKSNALYVCYRCHAQAKYPTGGTPHTGNGGDFQDYTSQVGTARVPFGNTGGNWAAYACGNCHGTATFGGIHGATEVLPDAGKGGSITTNCATTPSACRNAYRFTNGASMRFYDPKGWNTGGATCYTISSGEAGWAGCTKHSGGQSRTKAVVRPLSY